MYRGLFVTGTDTNVGKTVVCAALFHRYRARSSLRYWKPIQTGIEQDDDTANVRQLGACEEEELLCEGIRLPRPVSPHLAAALAGQTIDLTTLTGPIASRSARTRWIVEGAGGVLVPINDAHTMADVMTHLRLPVLIVARSTLGTINHTLLTLEALRARSARIAGVVMVGHPNADNRRAIEQYGKTDVLAEMPLFEPLTTAHLARWSSASFDPDGRLLDFVR
jgi:dethiobiotin synthetase